MTAHDPQFDRIGPHMLAQLDDLQRCAVLYRRLWCAGACGRAALRADAAATLGAARAAAALAALGDICAMLAPAPRPNPAACPRLSVDEAQFATLIAIAASPDREAALWLGMGMVRPDLAPHLTAAAANFGMRIRQMLLQRPQTSLH